MRKILTIAAVIGIGATVAYFKIKSQPALVTKITYPSEKPQVATASPSPDETANWKTYTEQDNSYTFQYPKTWDTHLGQGFIEVYCSNPNSIPKSKIECDPAYNVNSVTISKIIYKSIDEFVQKSGDIYSDKKTVTINGREAVEFVYSGSEQSGGSQLVWVIKDKDTLYKITYIYPKLFGAKTFKDFATPKPDILSTFKFVN